MKRLLMAAVAALSLNLAAAVEVAGVKFDDKIHVGTGDLGGPMVPVCARSGLQRSMRSLTCPRRGDADAVLAAKEQADCDQSVARPLGAAVRRNAAGRVANNHSEAEMVGLKDRLKQFSDTLLAAGEPKTGTSVVIDWLPESGTRLTINGQVKGKDIAGEDFYKALLKIWLGNKPVQDDLKQALLGKAS
jgi:hypothetical protein